MAIILTVGIKLPIIKIGRMAGQFAKPRSSPIENKYQHVFKWFSKLDQNPDFYKVNWFRNDEYIAAQINL